MNTSYWAQRYVKDFKLFRFYIDNKVFFYPLRKFFLSFYTLIVNRLSPNVRCCDVKDFLEESKSYAFAMKKSCFCIPIWVLLRAKNNAFKREAKGE